MSNQSYIESLENAKPWLVQRAIDFIDSFIKPGDKMFEVGSGGSTIYYAKKGCDVYSIETNAQNFLHLMKKYKQHANNGKIYPVFCDNMAEIPNDAFNSKYNIINIDPVFGYNRSTILEDLIIKKCLAPNCVIIMDNWSHCSMWPYLGEMDHKQLAEYFGKFILLDDLLNGEGINMQVRDFTDPTWLGSGTRIVILREN